MLSIFNRIIAIYFKCFIRKKRRWRSIRNPTIFVVLELSDLTSVVHQPWPISLHQFQCFSTFHFYVFLLGRSLPGSKRRRNDNSKMTWMAVLSRSYQSEKSSNILEKRFYPNGSIGSKGSKNLIVEPSAT